MIFGRQACFFLGQAFLQESKIPYLASLRGIIFPLLTYLFASLANDLH